jgi:hypothetical protein
LQLYYYQLEERLPELFGCANLRQCEAQHAFDSVVDIEVSLDFLAEGFEQNWPLVVLFQKV